MTDQLPALLPNNVPTPLGDRHLMPALIAELDEQASWRYVEFFTANICNTNTRRAYARASYRFLAWCEEHGLKLVRIRLHDVGVYIEAQW